MKSMKKSNSHMAGVDQSHIDQGHKNMGKVSYHHDMKNFSNKQNKQQKEKAIAAEAPGMEVSSKDKIKSANNMDSDLMSSSDS